MLVKQPLASPGYANDQGFSFHFLNKCITLLIVNNFLFSALEVITSKLKLVLSQLDSILSQLDTPGMYTYKRNSPVFKKRMGDKIRNFVFAAKTYYTTATK